MAWSSVAFATIAFYVGLRLSRHASGWLTMGAATTVTLAMVLVWYRDRMGDWLRVRGREVWTGVIAGVLMTAATYGGFALLAGAYGGPGAWLGLGNDLAGEIAALYDRTHAPPGPIRALPVLLLAILAEELVWRGVLIEAMERIERPAWIEADTRVYRGLPAAGVVALSAAAYALPQMGSSSPLLVGVAFGCGVIWGTLRMWTGAVTAPLIAHVIWDVAVLVVWPLA